LSESGVSDIEIAQGLSTREERVGIAPGKIPDLFALRLHEPAPSNCDESEIADSVVFWLRHIAVLF